MPRPKRTVGFWRGEPSVTKKTSLLPPADRFTNTAVDSWPRGYREELRHELLARRRRNPGMSTAALVLAARKWAASRPRPSGVPKTIDFKHVEVLLKPPRRSETRPSTPAAALRDRAPRPTTLTAEEIVATMRRSLRASLPPPPKKAIKPARKPLRTNASQNPAASGTQSARSEPNAAAMPRAVKATPPPAAAAEVRSVAITVRLTTRGAPEVEWDTLPGATRSRVDIATSDGVRQRRIRVNADAVPLRVGKVADLPQPLTITVVLSAAGGGIVATGTDSIDLC